MSVGIPAYDRPELLRKALTSLTRQTYPYLEIIVSDDCSPGTTTRDVVNEFAEADPRITYIRQPRNLGVILNYRFVFEVATGEFFFWASEDDEWDPTYFETGVRALTQQPRYDAWCCTIRNTDGFGRIIREYPGFSRWSSTNRKWLDLVHFILEPEIMGKSHVTHSIFRAPALRLMMREYFMNDRWGTDTSFATGFLCRSDLLASDEVLFEKRVVRDTDRAQAADPMVVRRPQRHIFPLIESVSYVREHFRAARSTRYRYLVLLVMLLRIPIAFRNELTFQLLLRAPWKALRVFASLTRKIQPGGTLRRRQWHRLFGYQPSISIVQVGSGVVETHGTICVPASSLRATLPGPTGEKLVRIEDTPHFRWIQSLVSGEENVVARSDYQVFLRSQASAEDADRRIEQVASLVKCMTATSLDELSIVTLEPRKVGNEEIVVVIDWVHLAALAHALKVKKIKCKLLSSAETRPEPL